jgi:hypothetical protein
MPLLLVDKTSERVQAFKAVPTKNEAGEYVNEARSIVKGVKVAEGIYTALPFLDENDEFILSAVKDLATIKES